MDKKTLEDKVFELVSYMVVSARNLLDEPKRYAPFRLVDAASRLVEILEDQDLCTPRLSSIREMIDKGKMTAMADDDEYREYLEGLVLALVDMME